MPLRASPIPNHNAAPPIPNHNAAPLPTMTCNCCFLPLHALSSDSEPILLDGSCVCAAISADRGLLAQPAAADRDRTGLAENADLPADLQKLRVHAFAALQQSLLPLLMTLECL